LRSRQRASLELAERILNFGDARGTAPGGKPLYRYSRYALHYAQSR